MYIDHSNLDSLKDMTHVFKKFKEYDAKLDKLEQTTKAFEKLERKYLNEIRKCPASKNIRDYELRHGKAKDEKERAELKRKSSIFVAIRLSGKIWIRASLTF